MTYCCILIILFIIIIYRDVVKGDEFLSLSSQQVIKLIACNDIAVPHEEKVR